MTDKTTPAFPEKAEPYSREDKSGMTLRDYFAAKAMQSITADPNAIDENTGEKLCLPEDAEQIALASYMMADAMMEARK